MGRGVLSIVLLVGSFVLGLSDSVYAKKPDSPVTPCVAALGQAPKRAVFEVRVKPSLKNPIDPDWFKKIAEIDEVEFLERVSDDAYVYSFTDAGMLKTIQAWAVYVDFKPLKK